MQNRNISVGLFVIGGLLLFATGMFLIGDRRQAFGQHIECRVGGGALARWPPSAAQTVRAVFPHTAFTKTHASEMQSKGSTESSSPARTRRTAWFPATVSSHRSATA